ncbi:MAG: DUF2779 domain-containing protein [Acidimicrobiia bacterium]
MQLSKSEYMMYLRHPSLVWYKKFDKTKLPPDDDNRLAIYAEGNYFETFAEQLFEDGIRIGFNSYDEYLQMPRFTKEAISTGKKVIFQSRFETEKITCICDVVKFLDENTVELYEIKSSSSVKQENIYDLAFQTHVLQLNGFNVKEIFVIHVNGNYVRSGEISPREICNVANITEEVLAEIDDTKLIIDEIFEFLKTKTPPSFDPPLDGEGDINAWLELFLFNNPQEKGSIFDLCWPKNRIAELYQMGIKNLIDIPDDFSLSPKQKLQVSAAKNDLVTVDKKKIKEFIDGFEYPLYFLDYETLASVIPPFDGLGPRKQLPFQFSLHVLEEPGGALQHYSYLHRDNSDPTTPLSEALKEHIGTSGTVLTWNERFEKSCNDLMGKVAPKYKNFYKKLNERIADLCIPFQKNWYIHKDFLGSYSIKKVLPVIVPELSYADLDINEGASAQRLWMKSVLADQYADQKEKILNDLDIYCELDTLAMVKIYEHLYSLVEEHKANEENQIVEKLTLF